MSTVTTGSQDWPKGIGLDDGGYVIVYSSDSHSGGHGNDIIRAIYDSTFTRIADEFAVDVTTDSQGEPEIAKLSDGGYIVTYVDSTVTDVYYKRWDSEHKSVSISGTAIQYLEDETLIC